MYYGQRLCWARSPCSQGTQRLGGGALVPGLQMNRVLSWSYKHGGGTLGKEGPMNFSWFVWL